MKENEEECNEKKEKDKIRRGDAEEEEKEGRKEEERRKGGRNLQTLRHGQRTRNFNNLVNTNAPSQRFGRNALFRVFFLVDSVISSEILEELYLIASARSSNDSCADCFDKLQCKNADSSGALSEADEDEMTLEILKQCHHCHNKCRPNKMMLLSRQHLPPMLQRC
ncbi:uncharacterized protein TrAtP1_002355 [Trichoderma atroviride]|uniref:uncharacterized protein n=1 Tax=Hypocrea atroviridis TaxID=63577 RepID=UPI0033249206|nr:hypothetical protein TrAtP1_002355 [Trichoderma atroviride]